MKVFGFVLARKAEHSIALMCRVLEVSRSGYHAWAARPLSAAGRRGRPADRPDPASCTRCAAVSTGRRGSGLTSSCDDGERIGRKRVERLMRQAGLSGLITKKYKATTVRVPGVRVADDLLDRDFSRRRSEPAMGGRHHLPADLGGLAVPRRGAGPLQPPDRRLEHGRSHAHRARQRRAADGARAPAPGPRADLPLRSGRPVRVAGVRPASPRCRDRAVDGQQGRLLRQRRRRELLRDDQEGAHPPPRVAEARPSCAPRSSTTSKSSTTASAATARSGNDPPSTTRTAL